MRAPVLERARELRAALALWRGPALADFTYEPFAQAPITALEELHVAALESRIEADLQLGRHAEMVAELEGLVAQHRLHEGLRGLLMLALYRCGRQAEALELYRDVRGLLVDELGTEPGPRLRALHRAILDHDPLLGAHEKTLVSDTAGARRSAGLSWLGAGRKTVTVIVVDVSARSSRLGHAIDAEVLGPVVTQAHAVVRAVVERNGGRVEGSVGDLIAVVFGLPVAHEDDAVRAVRAAATISRELSDVNAHAEMRHGVRLAARIAIDTGEIVVADRIAQEPVTSGPPFARAARLQQVADDGAVLLSDTSRRLVAAIAMVEPAGRDVEDGGAWQLVGVVDEPAGVTASDTTLVGRERELAQLADALDRTNRSRRAWLVTVLGEAGIGKSRLLRGFTDTIASRSVVVGRCRAYGDGITFWPLREIVQQIVGRIERRGLAELLSGEPDGASAAALIAAAVGLSDEGMERPADLFRAVRRLFEVAAADGSLVVVVDDAHWAQPTLLDLLEYLAAELRGPVLLVCLARHDLLADRPRWASEVAASATIALEPLATTEARRLVIDRLGGRPLAPEMMGQLLALGQGNPLFL